MSKRLFIFIARVSLIAAVPLIILAFSTGPEPFVTGNPADFGGQTCNQAGCHTGSAVNLTGGKVQIILTGAATYVPGQTQKITVTVSDPAQRGWGFQLTARLQANNAQAGDLTPIDASTQVVCSDDSPKITSCPAGLGMQFVEHTRPKTGTGSGTFTFNWTPPATDVGTIVMYAAGNAANLDTLPTGDHIYTTSVQLTSAAAGPVITAGGTVNGATFGALQPVAAGSLVSVFGNNFSSGLSLAPSVPLPTSLNNTSVTMNGIPAPLLFVAPGQINAQIPFEVLPGGGTGSVNVVVTNTGVPSPADPVTIAKVGPGVFAAQTKPTNYAIAYFGVDTDARFLKFAWPPGTLGGLTTFLAHPGDVLTVYATGLGAVSPAGVTGANSADQIRTTITQPIVLIGNVAAPVLFSGLSPFFVGVYQLNIVVPQGAPAGPAVPIQIQTGGVTTPADVNIGIATP